MYHTILWVGIIICVGALFLAFIAWNDIKSAYARIIDLEDSCSMTDDETLKADLLNLIVSNRIEISSNRKFMACCIVIALLSPFMAKLLILFLAAFFH